MADTLRYFKLSVLLTAVGLALAAVLGWAEAGLAGLATFLFSAVVLSVMEVSLSFDNAIVNAQKLRTMTPVWRQRFLTWGILIAVFGVRIVFPVLIVMIAAKINPVDAVVLAATKPADYAHIMEGAHLGIAGFAGAFLMMVALNFFIDHEKDVHWLNWPEAKFLSLADVKGLAVGLTLLAMLVVSRFIAAEDVATFFLAGIAGLVSFLAVEVLGHVLDAEDDVNNAAATGGFGAFMYLEVLDASFSFDGVIGAFAITQNMFLIAIGLGIGAMYVRSMTVMLVEKGTLAEYRFLEHGAFWAILSLAVIMFLQTFMHIPEVVTGLIGAGLIGLALMSSLAWRKANPAEAVPAE